MVTPSYHYDISNMGLDPLRKVNLIFRDSEGNSGDEGGTDTDEAEDNSIK